ncbi:MAG: hypothetical protein LBO20_04270, partial [Bifidobacteriaceae bacterium]|nr:hypothetical protein [Bifidobacteriaceae bacterium]
MRPGLAAFGQAVVGAPQAGGPVGDADEGPGRKTGAIGATYGQAGPGEGIAERSGAGGPAGGDGGPGGPANDGGDGLGRAAGDARGRGRGAGADGIVQRPVGGGKAARRARRKMAARMVARSVTRRRSRVAIAALAVAIGATNLFSLASIAVDIPRQMSREMRSYGANLVLAPA